MNETLLPKARLYASRRQIQVAEALGSGKDGIVFAGELKSGLTKVAIKIHRAEELYRRERDTYSRLAERGVRSVLGFNVPELLGFDDEFGVIEMTIVPTTNQGCAPGVFPL